MDHPGFSLLFRSATPMEARIVAGYLHSEGFQTFILCEDLATVFGGISTGEFGTQIRIAPTRLPDAVQLLKEADLEARFYGFEDYRDEPVEAHAIKNSRSRRELFLALTKYPVTLWALLAVPLMQVF